MADRPAHQNKRSSKVAKNIRPRSVDYYLYFSKNNKKIGALATNSFFQVREFLAREVTIPQKKDIVDALSNIIPKRPAPRVKNPADPKNDLKYIVKKSNEVLIEASTVFPFTLFPDTVTLDRTKLTITQRNFFMSSKVISIHVEDILNVTSQVGPLFGSLTIAIKGLTSEDHFHINYFWRKDAIRLKHMVQGYTMALHDKIDLSKLERKELIATLDELGHDSNP
ncbi:MAG TPA: hypothetical protein VD947_02945 [Patescibacteria group bacterium]|nr:hypothetical protein [Patescibacteria group bacterium]